MAGAGHKHPNYMAIFWYLAILTAVEIVEFALKFFIICNPRRVKRPIIDRRTNSATRLGIVPAIPEAAGARQNRDVLKRISEPGLSLPHLKLSHPWSVDQHAS